MHRSVSDTRPSPATGPPRRRTAGGGGSGRARRATSLGRALLGSLILATGLSLSVEVTAAVSRVAGLAPAAGFILQAVLMSAVVVPAILLLRRRVDRAPLAGLGWSLPAVRACLVGAGAAATASTATWVGAWLLGWITVVRVDAGALAIFLAVNTVVLTGYEALPEELSVRGYAWTSLHDGWGSAVATVVTTALFALNSVPTDLLQRVWAILLGNETEPIALAPNGTPAFFYIGHLVCFSLVLIAARRLPMSGALAAPISFHLVYLTANRVALGGLSRLGSGVKIELASPDVAVLALVPLALSGPAFVLLRKRLEARAVKRGADEPGSTTGS